MKYQKYIHLDYRLVKYCWYPTPRQNIRWNIIFLPFLVTIIVFFFQHFFYSILIDKIFQYLSIIIRSKNNKDIQIQIYNSTKIWSENKDNKSEKFNNLYLSNLMSRKRCDFTSAVLENRIYVQCDASRSKQLENWQFSLAYVHCTMYIVQLIKHTIRRVLNK